MKTQGKAAATATALALIVFAAPVLRAQEAAASGSGERAATTPTAATTAAQGPWNFRVLLDGKPIGHHRFTLEQKGAERVLRSEARFDVKLLGLTVYRYRHEATERWRGDCLAGLAARTDDDGEESVVEAVQEGGALTVRGPRGDEALPGCMLSFAYWNPAMLRQTRLLNVQTGAVEAVRIEPLGSETVRVSGADRAAQRWRVIGVEQPIELWYSLQGDWLALASTVSGGRKLSYLRE